jgi:hypothetical protein
MIPYALPGTVGDVIDGFTIVTRVPEKNIIKAVCPRNHTVITSLHNPTCLRCKADETELPPYV